MRGVTSIWYGFEDRVGHVKYYYGFHKLVHAVYQWYGILGRSRL